MTRKHFEALAEYAAREGLTDLQASALADVLAEFSDTFDRSRFGIRYVQHCKALQQAEG